MYYDFFGQKQYFVLLKVLSIDSHFFHARNDIWL